MSDKILTIKKSTLEDIANQVRAKTGSTDKIKVKDLDDAVANLSGGGGGIIEVDELPSPTILDPNTVGAVPNTGFIGKIILDTSLSEDEVVAELSKLTYAAEYENMNIIAMKADRSYALCAVYNNGIYVLADMVGGGPTGTPFMYFVYSPSVDVSASMGFSGWNPAFNGTIDFDSEVASEMTGMSVGVENNKIVNLVCSGDSMPNPEYDPESAYRVNKYGEKMETINVPIPSEEGSVIDTFVLAEGSKFNEEAFNLVDSILMGDENNKIYLVYQDESTNLYISTWLSPDLGYNYCLYRNGDVAGILWEFSKNDDGTRSMIRLGNAIGSITSPTEAPLSMTQSAAPERYHVGAYNEQLSPLFYTTSEQLNSNALIEQEYWITLNGKLVEMDEKIIPKEICDFYNPDFDFYIGQIFTIDDPITIDVPIIIENKLSQPNTQWYLFGTNDLSLYVPLYDINNKKFQMGRLSIRFYSSNDENSKYCNMEIKDSFSTHSIDHDYEIRTDEVRKFTLRELYNEIYGKAIVDRFPIRYGIIDYDDSIGLTETTMSGGLPLDASHNKVYKCLKIGN